LGLRLTIGRIGLRRGRSRHAGLGSDRGRSGRALHAALELPQAFFELTIAVLQLLVLAGQLPQLVFQLLDAHFRISIIGLGKTGGRQREQRGERRGDGHVMQTG
jgi:hypothetical protein